MNRRSGSMKIISSQCLLAQLTVTTCGHVEEGPNGDKLIFRVLGIVTGSVETLGHMNVGLSNDEMMK